MAAELPPPGSGPALGPAPAARSPAGAAELDAAVRLGSGPPTRARLAASVIVVRDGDGLRDGVDGDRDGDGVDGDRDRDGAPDRAGTVEVLLVQRHPASRFMGGVWVFPGGAVDAQDGEGDRAHRAAAVRELAEEAGVGGVDPAGLVKFSRWITPAELAVRFDTHFFVAALPAGQEPQVDGQECVAHAWFSAQAALNAHADGRIMLVFPTIRQLEQLRGFPSVAAVIDHARRREAPTARPRLLVREGQAAGVVMPDGPGAAAPDAAARDD